MSKSRANRFFVGQRVRIVWVPKNAARGWTDRIGAFAIVEGTGTDPDPGFDHSRKATHISVVLEGSQRPPMMAPMRAFEPCDDCVEKIA